MIGATGFAVVSAAAAFAPSAGYLSPLGPSWASSAPCLMPSTMSLIRNIFTNASSRRLAIAIWASCFTAGSALGPIVGGVLLEHFHWGAVFLVAVPSCCRCWCWRRGWCLSRATRVQVRSTHSVCCCH